MVLRWTAEQARRVADWYHESPRGRALINTGAMAAGMYIAGEAVGTVNPGLEFLIDMATPAVAGAYLNHKLNDDEVVESDGARTAAKVATAAVAAGLMAGTLVHYNGDAAVLEAVRDGYKHLHYGVANHVTGVRSPPGMTAGVIVGLGALVKRWFDYYRGARD